MKQGDIIELTITGISNEGDGIARLGDNKGEFVFFVADALPGETAVCRIVQLKKNYGLAKVIKLENQSEDRIKPLCQIFKICGGCQLQHINYDAQLKLKKQTVIDALTRIGKVEFPDIEECVASPKQWNYRNKAAVPVQATRTDNLKMGFYKKRSHDIASFESCPVLKNEINSAVAYLKKTLSENNLQGFNEKKKQNVNNIIRHIVLRTSNCSEKINAALIASRDLTKKERAGFAKSNKTIMDGLVLNENRSEGNFIWGDKFFTIYGNSELYQQIGPYKLKMEISSFFQVNTEQTVQLFTTVAKLAKAANAKNILELYSGVGSLTMFLAEIADSVTAVESWKPAAKYISINAKQNKFNNITPYPGTAEDISEKLSEQGKSYDTIVLDPPRTGCHERVIDAIIKINPQHIIYVSCNPATLARDLNRLIENNPAYKVNYVQPFDMFPQTCHVESVALVEQA